MARAQQEKPQPFEVAWADDGVLPLATMWLWDRWLPVSVLAVLAGKPGLGKSQLAVWLMAQITRGTLPGEYFGTPRPVLVVATEDDWLRTVKPRLIAAGANLALVGRLTVPEKPDKAYRLVLDDLDLEELRATITEHEIALVVFDPMVSVLRGESWNKAEVVRPQLEALQAVLEETGCSALGLMHFRKAFTSDIIDRIAGSGAFGQVIRAAIAIGQHPDADAENDSKIIVSLVKHNLGPGLADQCAVIESVDVEAQDGRIAAVSRFVLQGESDWSLEEVLNDNVTEKKQGAQAHAKAWLENYLQEKGETLIEVIKKDADAADINDRTLRRARSAINAEGRFQVSNRRETGRRNGKETWTLIPVGRTTSGSARPSTRSNPSNRDDGSDGMDGKDGNSLSRAVQPTSPGRSDRLDGSDGLDKSSPGQTTTKRRVVRRRGTR